MKTKKPPRGRNGFRKDGKRQHYFGCFPRAMSLVFGDQDGLSYEDYMGAIQKVKSRMMPDFGFDKDNYDDISIRDMAEITRGFKKRCPRALRPGGTTLKDLVEDGEYNDFVAIVDGQEGRLHAVPVKNGVQILNLRNVPEDTPIIYYIQ